MAGTADSIAKLSGSKLLKALLARRLAVENPEETPAGPGEELGIPDPSRVFREEMDRLEEQAKGPSGTARAKRRRPERSDRDRPIDTRLLDTRR